MSEHLDTVLALIYGTAKNNCINDCSMLIRCVKNHLSLSSNKLEQFHMCQKQLNSY